MIDPKGPLPRGTYLRRRALAVALAAGGVVVLIWSITALLDGGADGREVRGTGAEDQPTSAPPSTSALTPPPSSSTTAAPEPPPSPAPPPPPPDPNLPCPDAAVAVTAEVEAPSYRVGRRPALRLVVTNAGAVPCTRDVGRALRELVVTGADGVTRVWSNNDCARVSGQQPQVLQPGERLVFEVNWAGRTSAPGCPLSRTAVPPGNYLVVPRLGALVGTGVPLALLP
ncbi:hypothetical protein L6E12_18690 [Actinokineospora sp. PR83]|uniref:hypothetical protein n=1 Tax=Actinokineospora sp. PR83 TaxID=2884908 RepID=UPI001F211B48|nr:hypothetical protein [Actinokineospora sp. PR83]MCG8917811.1 hypothetical protein [Actinokineospora sp. PR83]